MLSTEMTSKFVEIYAIPAELRHAHQQNDRAVMETFCFPV